MKNKFIKGDILYIDKDYEGEEDYDGSIVLVLPNKATQKRSNQIWVEELWCNNSFVEFYPSKYTKISKKSTYTHSLSQPLQKLGNYYKLKQKEKVLQMLMSEDSSVRNFCIDCLLNKTIT